MESPLKGIFQTSLYQRAEPTEGATEQVSPAFSNSAAKDRARGVSPPVRSEKRIFPPDILRATPGSGRETQTWQTPQRTRFSPMSEAKNSSLPNPFWSVQTAVSAPISGGRSWAREALLVVLRQTRTRFTGPIS